MRADCAGITCRGYFFFFFSYRQRVERSSHKRIRGIAGWSCRGTPEWRAPVRLGWTSRTALPPWYRGAGRQRRGKPSDNSRSMCSYLGVHNRNAVQVSLKTPEKKICIMISIQSALYSGSETASEFSQIIKRQLVELDEREKKVNLKNPRINDFFWGISSFGRPKNLDLLFLVFFVN